MIVIRRNRSGSQESHDSSATKSSSSSSSTQSTSRTTTFANMKAYTTFIILLVGVLIPFSYQMVKSSYVNPNMITINNPADDDDDNNFPAAWNDEEIHGYHFHTYFFQNNVVSANEALIFRIAIQDRIESGALGNCRLNNVNTGPRGPHPIGSYETCCNKTSISPAISFFMQNRGNLSILLHALTRYEVEDHTTRSMFLGPRLPLDLSPLREDLGDNLDLCLPLPS